MKNVLFDLQQSLQSVPAKNVGIEDFHSKSSRSQEMKQLLNQRLENLPEEIRLRAIDEFEGFGPLAPLMTNPDITEILINGPQDIWFEQAGRLHRSHDEFISELTYQNFLDRLNLLTGLQISVEKPVAHGDYQNFRIHWVSRFLTKTTDALSFRRHPENPWTLEKLAEQGWSTAPGFRLLKQILAERKNFLVIGETGSGKTSVLNACLQALPQEERVVLLEDTKELCLPNSASLRLLSRTALSDVIGEITLTELVRNSLRLRPDRIVVGEVRGAEAKDLLLALSTGHGGSFGTLHAGHPQQALLRLEMLIQMGAPQWQSEIVRKLIGQSLQMIIMVGKNREGKRRLKSIHQLTSVEETGILLETIFQEDSGNERLFYSASATASS
jgi:pilus assembly protein CpaF